MDRHTPLLHFGFERIAEALATTILERSREGSFVVGITGSWGSGKTTLMNAVTAYFPAPDNIPVYFNAWAHSQRDEIWRGLFVAITYALREHILSRTSEESSPSLTDLDDAERSLYEAFTREEPGRIEIDGGRLAKAGIKIALRFVPWGPLATDVIKALSALGGREQEVSHTAKGEVLHHDKGQDVTSKDIDEVFGAFRRHIEKTEIRRVQSLEQFRGSIERALAKSLAPGQMLIVSIDDVDRCLPEQQLHVFEAVKLFLDLPGTSFLVGLDQDGLQHALDIRYGQSGVTDRRVSAEIYAEKMLDLTFSIPPPDEADFATFIASSLPLSAAIVLNRSLLDEGLPRTPRSWLRFAERANFHQKLIAKEGEKLSKESQSALLKLQLISFRWPAFTRAVGDVNMYLRVEACVFDAAVFSASFSDAAQKDGVLRALRSRSVELSKLPLSVVQPLEDLRLVRVLGSEPNLNDAAVHSKAFLGRLFNVSIEQFETKQK